jgi:hypothetical protein
MSNKFKKSFASLSTGLTYLYIASSVYAVNNVELTPPPGSIDPNLDPSKFPQLIIDLLFGVAAFLALAYLMYGGIKWITSRGDKTQVEAARKHIVAAVIGLVVVAGAFFGLRVLFTILGAGSNNPLQDGFKLPTLEP